MDLETQRSGRRVSGSFALATLAVAIASTAVQAQETPEPKSARTLEEVVVTAQRREENLSDVPISVVAISDDVLSRAGVDGTAAISEMVPSVQLVRSGPSGMFFVRGVGNTSGGTGEEGANAMYVDGVFLPDLKQSILKFNNIERIEVLKGPQGTLFGRNSSGGLVNVITKEPGDEVVADIKLGVANYDTSTAQAYVAAPLTDTLSADLAITSTNQSEGWGENEYDGKDVMKGWDWGVRSKWVWTPSDTAKISTSLEYTKQSDDFTTSFRLAPESVGLAPGSGAFLPPDDPYDTNTSDQQENLQRTWGVNITGEFDLGWATLTSITAHRDNENLSALDPDTGAAPVYHIDIDSTTESWQQELRLASNDADFISWQTGLFLLRTENELNPQESYGIALGGVGGGTEVYSKLTTWSTAAFGEMTFHLSEATQLTAGLRYTMDKRKIEAETFIYALPTAPVSSLTDSVVDEEPTYRLALHHDLTDTINLYASYNRGFKSGTYSMTAYVDPPVEPQTIDAFEVGMKSTWLDETLRLNMAAFHYEIADYQVRAATGVGADPILLNAAEVEVDGLEVEFEALPTDNLRLFGSVTWLKSEFTDFPFAPHTIPNPSNVGGASTVLMSAKGNDTPLAPELAGNLGVSYTIPLDAGQIDMTLLYSYNDGYYFEPDNRLDQPAFDTINASLLYQVGEHWALEAWGRNLTDETYYVQKLGSALADVAVPSAPRTYGVSVSYSY